uniref:Uncharacterized protein n=1 Tax=Arundo donax TaxID=35708 RepID=A0A0A9GC46_ARUDO
MNVFIVVSGVIYPSKKASNRSLRRTVEIPAQKVSFT